MKIYIQNGSVITASWTGTIATSIDGNNWSTFPKNQISVSIEEYNSETADPNAVPREESGRRVVIKNINTGELIVRFIHTEVANQSWTSASYAAKEINDWIGEVYP
jgi:hypothetical protein